MTELTADFDHNYQLFLEEAFATGCVWALESDDGFALCPSNTSEREVLPLWSQPEFAEVHAVNEWADYKPVPIAVEELMDDWLPGLHEELKLVGPNWNTALEGDELEPIDLLEDLDAVAAEG